MRLRPLLLALTAGLSTAAGQGQTTGSLTGTSVLDAPEGTTTGDRARAVFDVFSLCVVKFHHAQVVKALAKPADMAEDNKTLPGLMDRECISGKNAPPSVGGMEIELTTNPITFRGALFKALVRKDYARRPLLVAAATTELGGYNARALQFADCVVRADPPDSLRLLQAGAGSAAESAAIGDLKPHLGLCIVQGASMRMSKGTFTGFIAEAYYREADAARTSAGGR